MQEDRVVGRLRDVLGELEALFTSRAPVWEQWSRQSIALLDAHDPGAAEHVLQAFGGMGGLSDLVFDPENGNASSAEEAAWLQQALDARRSEAYGLATQLATGNGSG